nr:hypothetical protein CFP56_15926 [Quercus suber]
MRIQVQLEKDGKLIQLNLIQCLIEATIHLLLGVLTLFQYSAVLCHTAHGIPILMSMKTLQLMHPFWMSGLLINFRAFK